MKCWHLVSGRPIGPHWEVVLTEPKPIEDELNLYGTHWEETTLAEVIQQFLKHIEYAKEHFPANYFPYELKVYVSEDKP